MHTSSSLIVSLLTTAAAALPAPQNNLNASLADPNYGPIPGESRTYVDYNKTAAPFPGNITGAILPTESGPAGPDDLLFQNLLSAEWAIFDFYQQGVETFNSSSFTEFRLPNTTYDRVMQIRDNEAGHLRIFQDSISPTSVKPGSCTYDYGFNGNASVWLALQVSLEVISMAFLTGLVREATTTGTMSALVAISEVESRHNTWALIDVWNTNPFSGPADTVFPYANEILDLTRQYIVPGSCPAANPSYPSPTQKLPAATAIIEKAEGLIQIQFTDPHNQPDWYSEQRDRQYYAVYFHGVHNITMPFDTKTNTSAYPMDFDAGEGIIVAVIANEVGAPTLDSVVAGPALIIEQPAF
ncbi:unnamed protein product [Aureobasidium uvarum]|uniref:Stress response protein rds1p n=1 Tax=Aureobasidium uvarum TaxID=2773716 RepID=A0A9N8PVI8_9PEZI|nr:unnamed protein product [Aureobasidium uvarum]